MLVLGCFVLFQSLTVAAGQVKCQNMNINCVYWAKTGECWKNPRYMLWKCKPSCDTCWIAKRPAICQDNNVMCPFWTKNGKCKTNPDYMNYVCRKSCDKCWKTHVGGIRPRPHFLSAGITPRSPLTGRAATTMASVEGQEFMSRSYLNCCSICG